MDSHNLQKWEETKSYFKGSELSSYLLIQTVFCD
jgi:hypothetical protein